jgi:hypothetical protein
VLAQDLCGRCFAEANGIPWAVCAECVSEGITQIADSAGGYWHVECAAFALSVIDNPNPSFRRCNSRRAGEDAIPDYRDRNWCFDCAADALARLRVARQGLSQFRGGKK